MAYGTVLVDSVTTSTPGGVLGAGNASTMKNRIINGAMVIDQRNAGASVTANDNSFAVDRFKMYHQSVSGSKGNMQQNQGSVTPPVGFKNYLGFTTTSAYSVAAGDGYAFAQAIEGYNIADLGWGTANAKTVTLSFQVYSSLTGTFGGSFVNASATRSYPFSYSIPVANTWTTISVTVVGETTGTWTSTNGIGIFLFFSLGFGTTGSGTAGTWANAAYYSATGATSVVGTNGATFYITGVQLEVGSVATGFEYRVYGTELALCQRYYEKSYLMSNAPGTATTNGFFNFAQGSNASGNAIVCLRYAVAKRTAATISFWDDSGNPGQGVYSTSGGSGVTNPAADNGSEFNTRIYSNVGTGFAVCTLSFQWTASAEL